MAEFRPAGPADAGAIAQLRTDAADHLTGRFGKGPWSSRTTPRGVAGDLARGIVVLAHDGSALVGTLSLTTRKPWAIKPEYFTPARCPLYLINMAVAPGWQGRGVGRQMLAEAEAIARAWPADAIWLDAFDAPAGAGGFYARCGYTEVRRALYRGNPLVYLERRLDRPPSAETGPGLVPHPPSKLSRD